MGVAKAMDRLRSEKYLLNDVAKDQEPQSYLQNIQLHAVALGVEGRPVWREHD